MKIKTTRKNRPEKKKKKKTLSEISGGKIT